MISDELYARITRLVGSEKNIDIARVFDVRPSAVGNWKKRGGIPLEALVYFSQKKGISLDVVITGKPVARSGSTEPHYDLLEKAKQVLTHGDRLSQISLEKAILELHQAMDKSSKQFTDEESLIVSGGTAQT